MAAVELSYRAVLYDLQSKASYQVMLVGDAFLTGVGVGGGPMPPGQGGGGQQPPWWPGHPEHPIPPTVWPQPPGGGGGQQPPWWPGHPEHPIPPVVGGGPIYPPNVPPDIQPPTPPQPGDPTTPVPPPQGQGGWPVQPIVAPPYIIVNYPGVGPVYVAPPVPAG